MSPPVFPPHSIPNIPVHLPKNIDDIEMDPVFDALAAFGKTLKVHIFQIGTRTRGLNPQKFAGMGGLHRSIGCYQIAVRQDDVYRRIFVLESIKEGALPALLKFLQ